uniref:Uncharacterized protein n=1 Tax=Siphoviridae sp. ctnPP24 TaxID=2825662 RepID=A0A8S5TZ06_9CAUD|nr:MAG TPA: hypothetical protein [Siphoviridae sp. ctnPP24]
MDITQSLVLFSPIELPVLMNQAGVEPASSPSRFVNYII